MPTQFDASPPFDAHYVPNAAQTRSKDAIDQIAADRRTRAKNRRIAQLLPELLASLREFAPAAGHAPATNRLHGDIDGHIPIRRRHGHGRGHGRHVALLVDAHVRAREDALLGGPLADALPPLRVHVLGHGHAVARLQAQVAGVGGRVRVQRGGVRQRGGRGGRGGRGRGVGRRRGVLG